jgi:pimeloyl-ACP methyl ester carboxylesterase
MNHRIIRLGARTIELVESQGAGVPIILCHGNSGAANGWSQLLRSPLGQRYRMIALSFPGHGTSSPAYDPAAAYTIESLGRLVADVVRHLELSHYWLVGHALGGHAILEALDRFPDALGVMLVSAPPLSLDTLDKAFLPDPTDGRLFKGKLTVKEACMVASCFLSRTCPQVFNSVYANIRKTDHRFRPSLRQSLARGALRNEFACMETARVPIALVAGSADRFLSPAYFASLPEAMFWKQRTLIVDGAAHAVHLDAPERFEEILAEFISSSHPEHDLRAASAMLE